MPGRLSWLGGKASARDDQASVRRAKRHHKQVVKADRRGWRDHDQRDRVTFGD